LVPLSSVPGGHRRFADTSETSARPYKDKAKTAAKILFAIEFTSLLFLFGVNESVEWMRLQRLCHAANARSHRGSLRSKVFVVSNVTEINADFSSVEKIALEKKLGISAGKFAHARLISASAFRVS